MARKTKTNYKEVPTVEEELDISALNDDNQDGDNTLIQRLKPSKSVVEQYSITEELMKLDRTLPKTEQGRCSCLGISALTFPSMNNSMRSNMFTSHINQFLNLEHGEHPLIFTTAENVAGKAQQFVLPDKVKQSCLPKNCKI